MWAQRPPVCEVVERAAGEEPDCRSPVTVPAVVKTLPMPGMVLLASWLVQEGQMEVLGQQKRNWSPGVLHSPSQCCSRNQHLCVCARMLSSEYAERSPPEKG